jgi:hypothetical protein
MKRTHVVLATLLVGSAALVSVGQMAKAGSKADIFVVVDLNQRLALASISSAHNSSDATQFIYCQTVVSSTSVDTLCNATNSAGTNLSCTINPGNPNAAMMRQAALSINADSTVRFRADTSGFCTEILVTKGSVSPPKLQ